MTSLAASAPLGPENPVTWTLWWRITMLGSMCFFVAMGQVLGASIPPMIGSIMMDLHVGSGKAAQLASWGTLSIGLGNIWAVPTVAYIGSRYTILIGLTIFTACFFWQAAAQSYNSLLAARLVCGLSGGVVEAIGPVIVVVLFPREYTARAMSAYTFSLGAGAVFGPIFSGYMIDGLGNWRYPNYLFGSISAVNLVVTFLMFPEPIMNIRVPGDPDLPVLDDSSPVFKEAQSSETDQGLEAGRTEQIEMRSPLELTTSGYKPATVWSRRSFFFTIQHAHPVENYLVLLLTPFRVLAIPAVIFTVLLFGMAIATTISITTLVSTTFSHPPLSWSPGQVGLYNISLLIGMLAGVPVGGALSDWLSSRHFRRHGIFKPESILPLLIPFARGWHWAIDGMLWAITSTNFTGSGTIAISYAINSYPEKAIDIGVVINVVKNVIGFGISYLTVDWWMTDKYQMFLVLAVILLAIFLSALPLSIWGPRITQRTKSWVSGYNVE
ncbi:major facilitator superfamily domain-containing protein [Dactylonectria macrodidyma]|uniref:Major facilitator superfamily domain-containing protein n=1 Tax=Dactylonectria macrodidyma TaxID=307937 RepID=A0A9P9IUV6_9HYPO|nr:major facilitator superfamily domain-containing protein [Dactylonectria macrodidyma]